MTKPRQYLCILFKVQASKDYEACKRFPGQITVGIDARNGKVAVQGWTESTDLDVTQLAKRCQDYGVSEIVYTDISRDGTEQGVNREATGALAQAISVPVIASGGVSSAADIEILLPLEAQGVMGVIIGRALYTGAVKEVAVLANDSPAQIQGGGRIVYNGVPL